MEVLDRPVEAESRLREKNQITVPEPIIRVLEAGAGDRLLWEADPAEPRVVRVYVLPSDFAGSLTGVFGTTEQTIEFARAERAAWAE